MEKSEKSRLEMECDSMKKRAILYRKNIVDLEFKIEENLKKLKEKK